MNGNRYTKLIVKRKINYFKPDKIHFIAKNYYQG